MRASILRPDIPPRSQQAKSSANNVRQLNTCDAPTCLLHIHAWCKVVSTHSRTPMAGSTTPSDTTASAGQRHARNLGRRGSTPQAKRATVQGAGVDTSNLHATNSGPKAVRALLSRTLCTARAQSCTHANLRLLKQRLHTVYTRKASIMPTSAAGRTTLDLHPLRHVGVPHGHRRAASNLALAESHSVTD